MSEVFTVRLPDDLYNKIIVEIEKQGVTRREWFLRHVYTDVNKHSQVDEYSLLTRCLDSLHRRLNKETEE